MNYKNIISALFIAMIFAGGISCTNKTKSAKQGNDSIASDSVAATDNEEPVDVVISPEKSKKGNVTKFTFNYSGKEVNVIADENKYEYYVKIDNKKFPLESEDYDFGSIKDCRMYKNNIWIIGDKNVAGIYAAETSGIGVVCFNIDKKKIKDVVSCGGAKFSDNQVVYQKKELKNPDADCAADFKFKTITKKIFIDGKEKKPTEKEIISFIKEMYNGELYNDYDFLKKHCTKSLLKHLAAEYDYDDRGYACWLFRSGLQDGPSERHGIISIKPLGNSWYKYSYYDMGTKTENKIKVIIDGTTIKFDKVEQLTKF